MKKIIFFCLVFFSARSFASIDGYYTGYSAADLRANWESMLYKVYPCTNFRVLRTSHPYYFCTPISIYTHYYYFVEFIDDAFGTSSPMTNVTLATSTRPALNKNEFWIDSIESNSAISYVIDEGTPYAYTKYAHAYVDVLAVRVFKPSNLNKSQETATKSNELQSEENSKLGSIANSKSTDISLLEDIKHLFSSMKSKFSSYVEKQKCDTFGVCDDSNHPPELDDSAPELKNDTVDLANIQPLMSGSGSCPADMSISVLGQNQTISFQTFCELAERARPVVIAAAQVAAAWLVFGAL